MDYQGVRENAAKNLARQTIEIKIDRSIKSNDWLRVATKRARAEAEKSGVEWIAADVFVHLPEAGRCLVKRHGDQGFTAYG
jgi:hypothetical protein